MSTDFGNSDQKKKSKSKVKSRCQRRHSVMIENIKPNFLAKQGAETPFIRPEPLVGLN